MRKVMPRHRGRLCRLALSPRVPAPSRSVACSQSRHAMFALWLGLRAEEKVGQCSEETAPFQSGQSYFFFAFLAFLAAFFAFFAIGPPEGFGSRLMATSLAVSRPRLGVSEVHKPLSERSTLIPDVDYGRENYDVKHKALPLVKTLAPQPLRTYAQLRPWSQIPLVTLLRNSPTRTHDAHTTEPCAPLTEKCRIARRRSVEEEIGERGTKNGERRTVPWAVGRGPLRVALAVDCCVARWPLVVGRSVLCS